MRNLPRAPNFKYGLPKNNDNEKRFNLKTGIGVVGQSVEMGAAYKIDPSGVSQLAGVSAPSQGIFEPVAGADMGRGSPFTLVAEMLADDEIGVRLFNGAVGSSSLIFHWVGTVNMAGRSNSVAYRGNRASEGDGDPGHRGDFIYVNGATWEATTGNRHLVFTKVPLVFNGTTYYRDTGVTPDQPGGIRETGLTSAASPPIFPGSPVVGNTVADGGIVWTCVHVGAKTATSGTTYVMTNADIGFDPYGMCKRVRDALMAMPVGQRNRYVYIQNGQSDAGNAAALYNRAIQMLVLFFCGNPYKIVPVIGLSLFYVGASQAGYDAIESVLSSTGLNGAPDYVNSSLTTTLVGNGYHLALPGNAITDFGFYYGQSLYRYFGTDVGNLGLYSGQPHPEVSKVNMVAVAMYGPLLKILTNRA